MRLWTGRKGLVSVAWSLGNDLQGKPLMVPLLVAKGAVNLIALMCGFR